MSFISSILPLYEFIAANVMIFYYFCDKKMNEVVWNK